MSDTLPDRLSLDPSSPHFDSDILSSREIGIRFKGEEKTNVEEYCVSEGWIKIAMPNTRDRKGRPLLLKLNGEVEPFYKS